MLKSSGMWYRHKQIYRSQWSKSESTEITLRIYGKVGLKLNIQKTKIMASGPITSWQIDGNRDFIFWGSKITADVTADMKLKDTCSLGKKTMTNLDSI